MTKLTGHDDAWRAWDEAMGSNRMHHAWILAGLKGIGKGTFARAAAERLVTEAELPQPGWENHPDIIVLDHLPANDTEEEKRAEGKPWQRKRNITIDQVRRMQSRLITRPTLGARRVVIIDPADDMEKGAVNALLKSLEEPPVGTYFLLVTHRPGRLLPTIRSRCRMMRFAALAARDIDAVLRSEIPSADLPTRNAAIAAAEGSPGAALAYVEHDLGAMHGIMQRLVAEGDEQLALRGALAEAIGSRPDRERLQAAIDLARAVIGAELGGSDIARQQHVIDAHTELVRLGSQATTYNFDPGLLVLEIGALLASLAMPRETI
ncbi:AAA family ATPase [Novosphingobium sp.]|uniref:AAA family ATPase n=1 Tax=Novosphingobium sp. TaxID=1874826 RepID=UPI0025FE1893|nr:AAA family ATPase [Novosphingobium sp.]